MPGALYVARVAPTLAHVRFFSLPSARFLGFDSKARLEEVRQSLTAMANVDICRA